ncbi:hypothetical protein VT84_20670 [Gemmata sp. SH-PL17]|uniref:hypothetical protein n=1 Tax=Gemmata sp. SH-PL17 TaxID=1630693 RepID=UPI00069615B2|nr:hypothetical protein [Gemmata sp. SH-PL17]AMV26826.1 hypothetical protein VT84_20670 [Gemmata sp. SH-PL17]
MGKLTVYKNRLVHGLKNFNKDNLAGHVAGVGGIWSGYSYEVAKFTLDDSVSDTTVHTETKFKQWLDIVMPKIGPGHKNLRLYLCLTKSPCKRCTVVALKYIAETYGARFAAMKLGFLNIYTTTSDAKGSFKDENEASGYYLANLNSAWKVTWFSYDEGKLRLIADKRVTTIVK